MIRFGMPSLIELNSIEENLMLCKKLGLEFVEINMNMFYCLPESNHIDTINQLLTDNNLHLTMHFPEEVDFGTFYEELRRANIELFKRYCIYGAKLGVTKINIHLNPGTLVTLPDRKNYTYEKNSELFIKNLSNSLIEIIEFAKNYHIKLCIENTIVPKFLEEVFEIIALIDGVNFTYDIGHDAKAKYNVEALYERLGEKVIHMHLHDYDQLTDHQILFKGCIDLDKKLNFANKNNMSVVIEVKSELALEESVNNLRKRRYL